VPDLSLAAVTVPLVAPRPDGSRVTTVEVVDLLTRWRVAAAVRDGSEIGHPGLVLATFAADEEDGSVATWDGSVSQGMTLAQLATIAAEELRTSVIAEVRERSTIAVLADGTEIETSERDRDPERAAIVLALQARGNSRAVNAYASEDRVNAEFLARATKAELPVTTVDGWTVVRMPDGHEGTEAPAGVTAEQPLAVRVEQNGRQAVVQVVQHRTDGRLAFYALSTPAATLVHDDYPAELGSLLLDDDRLVLDEGSAELDAELAATVERAGEDPATFVRTILTALNVPAEVVRWAEGGEPGPGAATVRPRSMVAILGSGMRGQADRDAQRPGFFGWYTRLVHGNPARSIVWGLLEIVVAVVLLTVAASWDLSTWLRVALAILWLVDGVSNVAWGVLRRRAR
jgi:hypothetical protein